MKQLSLAETGFLPKAGKQTRKAVFLSEMEMVVPWSRLEALTILVPTKKPKGGELTDQQKQSNRILSAIRAVVEHPFRVIKRQFGFTKVCYRGLTKNTGQIVTLFVLSNLWMARHRLMPTTGEVDP